MVVGRAMDITGSHFDGLCLGEAMSDICGECPC